MMRRRDFITLLGGAAAWPVAARAQQPALPVVGYLSNRSPGEDPGMQAAFHQGLSEAGYIEGRSVNIEYRWAEGVNDRLPALAADLVRRRVSVIAAMGGFPSASAAKAATASIPIVFRSGVDPVKAGLVTSLNRPGGNLTGATELTVELGPKKLELMHELVPAASTVAFLVNPTSAVADSMSRDATDAARTFGLQVHVLHASTESDMDVAFSTLAQLRADALVIGSDGFFDSRSEQLAALALRYAIPTIFQYRKFATAGGLISYAGSVADAYRVAGIYTGRILKGERPADLPIQQTTKFELIINLKTAKALGITIPLSLLTRADEVIE
jgi:putative ABC transport system substrate-binding protein